MADAETATTRRHITLVADELRGIQGGGLGTVFAFLGIALARLGHCDLKHEGGAEHLPARAARLLHALIEAVWIEDGQLFGAIVRALWSQESHGMRWQ